jgi:hypothetical protein
MTFFLFFLFGLTICEEGRRGMIPSPTLQYVYLHFMTELDFSVNLYEIFHLV